MPPMKLDDLLTGSQADLDFWFANDFISTSEIDMNSRLPLSDPDPLKASALNFGQVLGQSNGRIFVLPPVSLP